MSATCWIRTATRPIANPNYDANGNTLSYSGETYTYDAENRLIKRSKEAMHNNMDMFSGFYAGENE
jgi:hypothetical protein